MFLFKKNQVASIVKDFPRRQNRAEGQENDWLERYTIFLKPAQGPQGEQLATYEPWIVHAHFDSDATNAEPGRIHMKRNAEKDWGIDRNPYHSLPLRTKTLDLVKQEAQKQEAPEKDAQTQQGASKKAGRRKRR